MNQNPGAANEYGPDQAYEELVRRSYVPAFMKRAAQLGRPLDEKSLPEALEIAWMAVESKSNIKAAAVKRANELLKGQLDLAGDSVQTDREASILEDVGASASDPSLIEAALRATGAWDG